MDNKTKKRNLLILSIGLLISGLTACSYIEDLWGTLDSKGATRTSEMNISTVQRDIWSQEKENQRREQNVAFMMNANPNYTRDYALRLYNEDKSKRSYYERYSYYPDIKGDDCIKLSEDEFLHDFMAEKFANQLTGEPTKQVLRIKVALEIIHTDDDLQCEGTVKWDDSTKDDIRFYRYKNEDDVSWWGWSN